MGPSSSKVSNHVVSSLVVKMAQQQTIQSVVVTDASQTVAVIGNNNLIENLAMDMTLHTTAYVTGDAKLDAQLATQLSATLSTSLQSQQVALLGALNSQKDSVNNLIENSCAADLSSAQLQSCFVSAATNQNFSVIGNNNVIRNVKMTVVRDTFATCVGSSAQKSDVVSKTQAWADSQAKETQVNPLDGLFNALGNLTAGVGMIPLVIAASVAGIVLMIVFFAFGGGQGSAPMYINGGAAAAARFIPLWFGGTTGGSAGDSAGDPAENSNNSGAPIGAPRCIVPPPDDAKSSSSSSSDSESDSEEQKEEGKGKSDDAIAPAD
jgi:hypothetical protein